MLDYWEPSGRAANLLWPVPLACVDKRDSLFPKSNALADALQCQESSWPPTFHCKMSSKFRSLGFLNVLDKSASEVGFRVGFHQVRQSSCWEAVR